MTSAPKDVTCMEKEKVTFSCELNRPNVPVKWLKNGQEITPEMGYEVQSDGQKHTLVIPQSKLDDATVYTVVAGDIKADSTLTVDGNCCDMHRLFAVTIPRMRCHPFALELCTLELDVNHDFMHFTITIVL